MPYEGIFRGIDKYGWRYVVAAAEMSNTSPVAALALDAELLSIVDYALCITIKT